MEKAWAGRWPVALALGAVAMAAAIGGQSGEARAQASYEAQPRAPQYLYDRTCGYCHGHNVGPIILGRGLPPQLISAIVRSGNGAMPAFRPTEITDAELAALAQWIAQAPASTEEHGR